MIDQIKESVRKEGHNVFCFTGKPLTGKSTNLRKTHYQLIEDREFNFINLGVIDPSIFKESATFINIILANMFSYFKDRMGDNLNNEGMKRQLTLSFQETYSAIQNLNGVQMEESLDMLINLSSASESQLKFKKLVNDFISFFEVKGKQNILLLTLDECNYFSDHENMLDDINNFLIQNNIIILISCDVTSLQIPSHKTHKIAKVLPISQRMYSNEITETNGN